MYKVLIVDDEFRILEGLRKIVEWEEYDVEIIGEASNGKQALEMILKNKPNILITDIKMPVMDGIELIKEIHNRRLNIRVIVLSGYDSFDYVRQAMKCGAENYLLKPVEKEELVLTITEIIEDLDKFLFKEIQNREGIKHIKNNTLNRIIKNEINTKEFKEKLEFLDLDLYSSNMHVAVLQRCFRHQNPSEDNESQELKLFSIHNVCEETVDDSTNCIIFPDQEDHIVFIFNKPYYDSFKIQNILGKCIKNINLYLNFNVGVSVGFPVENYKDLHKSYKQAVKGLEYIIVYGINRVIIFDEIKLDLAKNHVHFEIEYDRIKSTISTLDQEVLLNYIDFIYKELSNNLLDLSPEVLRNISGEIIAIMVTEMKHSVKNNDMELEVYDQTLLNKIAKADDINTLKDLIIDIAGKVINLLTQFRKSKYSKVVNDTVEYINENYYQQNISLKTLAGSMKISPVHLGRTFKTSTGEYFSDYLSNVRIDKAKDLLLETKMKINDISNQVGFTNIAYFYTIFKKYTGSNPAEYRNV